jgi:hypothetical protein
LKLWENLEKLGLSVGEILTDFRSKLYRPLFNRVSGLVSRIVPKDTGELQEAMLEQPEDSEALINDLDGGGYEMILATPNIPYATVVSLMGTGRLAHTRSMGKRGRLGTLLHDPTAEGKWFDKVLRDSRSTARALRDDFYRAIAKRLAPVKKFIRGQPINVVKRLFRTIIPTR